MGEKKKETGGKTEIETVGENKFYKSGKIVVVCYKFHL